MFVSIANIFHINTSSCFTSKFVAWTPTQMKRVKVCNFLVPPMSSQFAFLKLRPSATLNLFKISIPQIDSKFSTIRKATLSCKYTQNNVGLPTYSVFLHMSGLSSLPVLQFLYPSQRWTLFMHVSLSHWNSSGLQLNKSKQKLGQNFQKDGTSF